MEGAARVDEGWAVPPDDPAAWTRAVAIAKRAFGRVASVAKGLYLATGLALFVGTFLHGFGAPIAIANLFGAAGAIVFVGIAAMPLRDPELRAAIELISNHQVREAREWKAETGTRMPRSRPAARRWLDTRPGAVGSGTMLTVIGRFAEADGYWRDHPGATPEEAFSVEVQRETATLLSGRDPDTARLHRLWAGLPETPERRNRRECLAILEAEARAGHGIDPIRLIAEARPDAPGPAWRATIPFALAFHVGIALVPLLVATGWRSLAGV